MALLLFQALPEGLPASVEPAKVRGCPGGAARGASGVAPCLSAVSLGPGPAVGGPRA